MLATAADIVADPSAPDAFVSGIMEGKEWVWEGGILREQQATITKKRINSLVDQGRLEEHKLNYSLILIKSISSINKYRKISEKATIYTKWKT